MNDLDLAREAARRGAQVVRSLPLQTVSFKGSVNPVTDIDTASQEQILAVLSEHRPDDAILAEEQAGGARTDGRLWLVDPLDGTVNFVHGIPHVGVSIALYEDSNPLVGVVIDVFREEEFLAVAGFGAWLAGRQLRVSSLDLDSSLSATGFPYDRRERAGALGATVGNVLSRVQGLRRMGTASLDLAWVAAGRFDVYWEVELCPWDVAAGILLVREAGGVVSCPDGSPATPFDSDFVVSNGVAHEAFRTLVAPSMI